MLSHVALVLTPMLAVCLAGLPSETIVYPRLLESRSLNGEKMLHIREGLTLNLEKSRSLFSDDFVFTEIVGGRPVGIKEIVGGTPVGIKEIVGGTPVGIRMNGEDLQRNLYLDSNHGSVLFVDEENEAVKVRGILSDKLSIEPLSVGGRSYDGLVPHKLSELDQIDDRLIGDAVRNLHLSTREAGQSSLQVTERKLDKLPEEFLVEVRILSDPSHSMNRTRQNLIDYFALIFSKVNLFFKDLPEPKVQFAIVGIERNTNESFAKKFFDPGRQKTVFDVCGTVGPFGKHVKDTMKQRAQDAVLYFTALNTGYRRKDGKIIGGIDGCSSVCGVCTQSPVAVIALMRPKPGNWDFHLVTHEIEHLLGMNHAYKLRSQGLDNQERNQGYPTEVRKQLYPFPNRTQEQIKRCLIRKTPECFQLTGGKRII